MANSFGQYTSGIQGVQGISEAGANIGKFNQIGLQNFGSSLAEGINTYNDNVQKDSILTEQLKGMGQQVLQYHDIISKDPSMKGLADKMQPILDQFQKAPSMSMGQKQGLLLSGQSTLAQILPQYQMQSAVNDAETKRRMLEANLPTTTTTNVDKSLKAGDVEFDPSISPTQNLARFNANMKDAQAHGIVVDPDAYNRFLASANKSITNNPKLDPKVKETLLAQMGAEKNAGADAMSYWMNEDKTGEATKRLDMLDKSAKTIMTEDVQSRIDAMRGSNVDTSSAIEALTKEKADIQAKIDAGNIVEGSFVPSTVGKIKNWLDNVSENRFAARALMRTYRATGEPITTEAVNKALDNMNSVGGRLLGVPAGAMVKAYLDETFNIFGAETLTNKDKEVIQNTIDERVKASDSSGSYFGGLYKKDAKDQVASIDARLEDLRTKLLNTPIGKLEQERSAITGEAGANATPEQQQAALVASKAKFAPIANADEFSIGYKPEEQAIKIQDQKRQMLDWFKTTHGAIPNNFDDYFNKLHPEASLQFATTPTGSTVMFTDGKWHELSTKQGVSKEEQAAYGARIKGIQDPKTGNIIDWQDIGIKNNSGIKIRGIVQGEKAEVVEYNNLIKRAGSALNNIAKLEAMIPKTGKSFDLTLRGEADRIASFLAADLRPIVFKGARAAGWEQPQLEALVSKPTNFWSLDKVNANNLKTVKQAIIDEVQSASKDAKVEFTSSGQVSPEEHAKLVLALKLGGR